MSEPGLDMHEWETEWADLDEAAADSPDETLPEMVRVIGAMLAARGFQLDEPITAEGEEPEILRSYVAARELAGVLDRGVDVENEDVVEAIDDLRAVHDYVINERAAP
jgi:hypothetical protein